MANMVSVKVFNFNGPQKDINRFKKFVKTKIEDFSLNSIIPMPDDLDINEYRNAERLSELLEKTDKLLTIENILNIAKENNIEDVDEYIANLAVKYLNNKRKYGFRDWYDWRVSNWGCKWDTEDSKMEFDKKFNPVYTFYVPNNFPFPIFKRLAMEFPTLCFEVMFADEDVAYNTGRLQIRKSSIIESFINDESDDAYEIYFQTHEWARDFWTKGEHGWECNR